MKRKFRITRSIDFKRVRHVGRSYAHPLVVLVAFPNNCGNSRAGFITGKAIGNAVKRNRVKRQLRTILSDLLPSFLRSTDVVIIARELIRKATYLEIQNAVKRLLFRAELLTPDEHNAGRPAG